MISKFAYKGLIVLYWILLHPEAIDGVNDFKLVFIRVVYTFNSY